MSKSSRIARGIVVAIPALTAIAIVGLGISRSSADIGRSGHQCIGLSSEIGGPMPDSALGARSQSTGELLQGGSVYVVAHVEQSDGQVHPAFGPFSRGIYLLRTESGRLVVRIRDQAPDHGWYGPY